MPIIRQRAKQKCCSLGKTKGGGCIFTKTLKYWAWDWMCVSGLLLVGIVAGFLTLLTGVLITTLAPFVDCRSEAAWLCSQRCSKTPSCSLLSLTADAKDGSLDLGQGEEGLQLPLHPPLSVCGEVLTIISARPPPYI